MQLLSFLRRHRLKVTLTLVALLALVVGIPVALADADPEVTLTLTSSSNSTSTGSTFLPGETLTFHVVVDNEAGSGADNVWQGTYGFVTNNDKLTVVGSTMPAGQQTLNPGASVAFDVTVQVASDYSLTTGAISVAPEASATGNEDGDDQVTLKLFAPRLTITKTTTATTIQPNKKIPYVITVTNIGGAPAENVVVTDTLPALLTPPSPAPITCSFAGQLMTCNLGTILSGNNNPNKKVNFDALVPAATTCPQPVIANQATVDADVIDPVTSTAAQTTVTCPTPTPTPTATPTATPNPTPTATPNPTPTPTPSSSSSSGSGSSSGSSTGTTTTVAAVAGTVTNATNRQGKVLGATAVGVSAADLKAPDYIPHARVPVVVDQLFRQIFGRKITGAESTCWKLRARSDKATLSKLKGAMQFHKGKGGTGFTATCKPGKQILSPKLVPALFKIVYGRTATASELKYWLGRHKSKPGLSDLRGAMLFHKASKISH